MLLKRASAFLPEYSRAHIPILEAAGIKTTENLVFTPLDILSALAPSIPEHELADLVQRSLDLSSGIARSGAKVLEEEKAKPVGWQGFGALGVTGLVEPWDGVGVVELCGLRRVGKSLLAMHAALRQLHADPQATCHWLDTDGSFASGRAQTILTSWGEVDPNSVLSRIIVTPCFRLDPDLHQALDAVRSSLEMAPEDAQVEGHDAPRIRVLVVDQITSLFKDHQVNTNSAGQAAMLTVMEDIADLTYSHNLSTFITNGHASSVPTNQLSRFSGTTIKPALGLPFSFCTDVTLLLQETGKLFGLLDEGERERARSAPGLRAVVEVLKSRVSPAGRWAVFETDGTKLMDVVPPPLEDEKTLRQSAGLPVGEARPAIGSLAQTLAP